MSPQVDGASIAWLLIGADGSPEHDLREQVERELKQRFASREAWERAYRRAVETLAGIGISVGRRSATGASLVDVRGLRDLGTSPLLPLAAEHGAVREAVARVVRFLDPNAFGRTNDPWLLLKAHVRDRISFRYGDDDTEWIGVPQVFISCDRPTVTIDTTQGRRAFFVDAIHDIAVTARASIDDPRLDEASETELKPIPAEPIERLDEYYAPRGRGRPENRQALLKALRIAGAVRSAGSVGPDAPDRRVLRIEDAARLAGVPVSEAKRLIPLAVRADPTLRRNGPELSVGAARQRATIGGPEALVAQCELTAFDSLGSARASLLSSLGLTIDRVAEREYRAKLDAFLSRAEPPAVIQSPCAEVIVVAVLDGGIYDVLVHLSGAPEHERMLAIEGLHLQGWRWIVRGSLDGQADQEIPLAGIVEAIASD